MKNKLILLLLCLVCTGLGFLMAHFFENIQNGFINIIGLIGSLILAVFTIILAVKSQLDK